MKKIILSSFVVLATVFSFSSCKDDTAEMTDSELYTEILNYGKYSDEEVGDLDELTVSMNLAVYTWAGDTMSYGTWTVSGGNLIITDTQAVGAANPGATTTLAISNEGKELTNSTGDVLKKQ